MEAMDPDPARCALFESCEREFCAHTQRKSSFSLKLRYEKAWRKLDLSDCYSADKAEVEDVVKNLKTAGLVRSCLVIP
jgi:hypothetical protein